MRGEQGTGGPEFRILGSLQVLVAGEDRPVPGDKLQALLARLLLEPNRPVSTDRLIDDLWGDEPPATARQSLHAHVARLRRVLASDGDDGSRLVNERRGYVLRVDDGQLDATRFRTTLAAAREERRAGRLEKARELYGAALGLWRGPVLDGVPLGRADGERSELEGLRLTALEERIDVDLELGAAAELVPELERLVRTDGLRERAWAQLMLALYASGRQADALGAYQEARRALASLGLEPGPNLRELERAILNHEPGLVTAAPPPRAATAALDKERMEIRILGPVEADANGRPAQLGGGKQRSLLAMLALRAGEVVSTDAIADGLWGERPPETAAKSIQVHVSRLRRELGDEVIATRAPGYMLSIQPHQLDTTRFEQLVREADGLRAAERAAMLRSALALWRGEPLADIPEKAFAHAEIARLEELRLGALEDRIEADLATGRSANVAAELEGLVRRHPYRERMRAQLMLALYRCGRQADALDVYRDTRTTLSDELGLEPSDELRALERRILEHDPALLVAEESTDELSQPGRLVRRRRAAVAVLAATVLVAAGGTTAALVVSRSDGGVTPVVAAANSVAVIDPGTGAVAAAIPVGARPSRIAVFNDDVWVLQPDARTLSHLSRSGRALTGTVGIDGAPSGVVADAQGAWVTDARSGDVTLIEPGRLAAVRRIATRDRPVPGPYSDAGSAAVGFGSLWYASGESTIARVDLRTGRVVARIEDVKTSDSAGGITFLDGSVWVAGEFQEDPVTRIDPTTNSVVASIPLDKYRSSAISALGDSVWVTDAANDQVWRILASRNAAVGTTKVGAAPMGVTSGAGSIWIANAGDGTVSRIDPTTGAVTQTIEVGGSPSWIVSADDEIWVAVG